MRQVQRPRSTKKITFITSRIGQDRCRPVSAGGAAMHSVSVRSHWVVQFVPVCSTRISGVHIGGPSGRGRLRFQGFSQFIASCRGFEAASFSWALANFRLWASNRTGPSTGSAADLLTTSLSHASARGQHVVPGATIQCPRATAVAARKGSEPFGALPLPPNTSPKNCRITRRAGRTVPQRAQCDPPQGRRGPQHAN
jgi:hypothetical protein